MLFSTPAQFIALAVLLIGGWLLGFASAPSARRWRRRVREQSDSFTAYHSEAEDRVRAANQRALDLSAEAHALRADHAEAERTIAALRAAVAAATVAPVPEPAPAEPQRPALSLVETNDAEPDVVAPPVSAPRPAADDALPSPAASPEPMADSSADPAPVKSWFASTPRDDLTRMRGIDSLLNTRLFGLGVTRFEDLEKLSAEDEMALEQRLALPVGYVAREQWRTQAALLRAGQDADHAAQFGTTAPASTL